MREIKFAWVCRNIQFNEIHRVVLTDDLLLNGSYPAWITSGNCEVMAKILPTGLKDKNGVEIYEGDIVKFLVPSGTWSNPQLVQFSRGSFSTKSGALWGLGYFPDIVHDDKLAFLEVIGNIYEKPALLGIADAKQ